MIGELQYPKGLIAIEKALPLLRRRVDILCYLPCKTGLEPLLLIECKKNGWDLSAEKQLLGYNFSVGAPFVALAEGRQIKTFWREKENIAFVPFLPKYSDLVKQL